MNGIDVEADDEDEEELDVVTGGSVVVDDVLDGGGGGMRRSILDLIESILDVIREFSKLLLLLVASSPMQLLLVKLEKN